MMVEEDDRILGRTLGILMLLGAGYSLLLAIAQRRFAELRTDYLWAEVAGGVMITLLPVAMTARQCTQISWRRYENLVWGGFLATGMPIILWQIVEAMNRNADLQRYLRTERWAKGIEE